MLSGRYAAGLAALNPHQSWVEPSLCARRRSPRFGFGRGASTDPVASAERPQLACHNIHDLEMGDHSAPVGSAGERKPALRVTGLADVTIHVCRFSVYAHPGQSEIAADEERI